MDTDKKRILFYLEELSDYKVADRNKDVRGWKVKDKDGRLVGKVDNLLVNKENERVVYLDIEVDASIIEANHKPYSSRTSDGVHEFLNREGEDHLILPIGMANLNLESEIVFTEEIDHKTFAETKRIKKGTPFYRDYEETVLGTYNRKENIKKYPEGDSFYDREEFSSDDK